MRKRLAAIVSCAAVAAILFCVPVRANDVQINPVGPVFPINNLVWGSSGAQGFNNNYFFAPLSQNESTCVYVYNNNTTSAHTFIASIVITANNNEKTPSDGTWLSSATSNGIVSAISPGIPGGLGGNVSGASLVSINLSGSSTQTGSPDTASVIIVQTQGNCVAGQNFTGSGVSGISSLQPILAISDGLSSSFSALTSATNPGSGQVLLHVNANSSSKTTYFTKLIITSTAATAPLINIVTTSSIGTSCANVNPFNLKSFTSPIASVDSVTQNCSVSAPTSNPFINIVLPTNVTQVIDLTGSIGPAGTNTGIAVEAGGAITGTVYTTLIWYEK